MTTSESPRLSALQLLMREWAALAPYNGIHAMRLSAPADVDRWQKAVTAAMQTVRTLPANIAIDRPSTDLDTHVDAELHRPFSAVAGPIRFFVVEEKSSGHWFGTVFDHWLADDFSCRALLQRIYSIYRGEAGDGNSSPLEWMPSPRRRRARWREWRDFFKQAAMLRRACRTSLRDPLDFRVRTFNVALPGGTLEATQKLAKDLGATLHDVFLAATAQVFGARQKWEDGARRDSVAIASAIDLRRFEPEPTRSGFGLVINQYIVMERRP
jgi:NRPS condensation-like uncharacterized protein